MRTKTLLLTAAALAAGLISASAQVYSQNIVGYINLNLVSGFNLVANQLNATSGNNTLNTILPVVTDGTTTYKFLPNGSFQQDIYSAAAPAGWYDNVLGTPSTTTLSPGEGFFIFSPGAQAVTLVGEVKTGLATVALNSGFSLVSSVVPASYQLLSPDFPAADGMLYYKLLPSGQFEQDIYSAAAPAGWYDNVLGTPTVVQPAVGQGFFILNPSSSVNWSRTFTP